MAAQAISNDSSGEPVESLSKANSSSASAIAPVQQDEDDEGDDDRMDIATIQSFADKVQHLSSGESRPKITIPKRGEKDFEPLAETVNLQERMLQRSREALFGALQGVRGTNSKAIAHALLTETSPYPRILVTRGHLLDTMGTSIRHTALPGSSKNQTFTELMPEEALYLLERGTLQIWLGREARTEEEVQAGVGSWVDEDYGVGGAVEMSVMEGYGLFLNKDGLSWERYQAYASLKRLGYTVHRPRRFIPHRFTDEITAVEKVNKQTRPLPPFRTWWTKLPEWLAGLYRNSISTMFAKLSIGLGVNIYSVLGRRRCLEGTLLKSWRGSAYPSLFSHVRLIPSGHVIALPPRSYPIHSASHVYDCLAENPYIPFWYVWKPAVAWSKAKWDRGSAEGLLNQRPDFQIAVVEARNTPIPTIHQLEEVFDMLPEEPKGASRKLGPQYERPPRAARVDTTMPTTLERFASWLPFFNVKAKQGINQGNLMGALRNGDKGLVVAVNDSGNTGWVRFGRSGFAEAAVI